VGRGVESKRSKAEVVREYGPFPGVGAINGVTFDGEAVWVATGDRLQSLVPDSGRPGRAIDVQADAGTAFDGQHLYQIAGGVIQKIDPATGAVVHTVPSPAGEDSAGLTWAEGTLWVASHGERKILQVDPASGRVLRTITSTKLVTGVTFVDGELWHATWEDEASELRRIAPDSGEVLESLEMPEGASVTGLESDGRDLFYCGGGRAGTLRVVRRPRRAASR
jgi:DNA-binding beta-propeller fold protein YncE